MNLQKELENMLDCVRHEAEVPPLVLHVCCAPCAGYVLEYLSPHFAITICWYNPNIYPESEHALRFDALSRMLEQMSFENPVELVRLPYEPDIFRGAVRGLELEPEGGNRCETCFRMRLERAAALAAHRGVRYFATTLSVGPRKNAALLHEISIALAKKYNITALPCDFKKRGGYARSIAISRELEIYRQNYCGCSYSIINGDSLAAPVD